MKTLAVVALVLLGSIAAAQTPTTTLSGRVLDAKTRQPVPFATVYLNNTSRGTTADENGGYRLTGVPLGSQELIGSSLGYRATRQPLRLTDTRSRAVDLILTPADNSLATVTVTARHNQAWVRQFRQFSRELLGNRPQARQCTILNENALSFSDEKGHFQAQGSEPLVIENKALGYRLTYTLLHFDLYRGQMQFAGTSRFEDLTPDNDRQQAQWQANRLKVYRGSLRHLLVSLLTGTQDQEGYTVYRAPLAMNPNTTALPLVRTPDRKRIGPEQAAALFKSGELPFERRLISDQPLEVYYNRTYAGNSPYRDSPYAYSMLLLPNQSVDLTTDGWITQGNGLDVRGYLGNDRLATLLPIDWVPTDHETLTAQAVTVGRQLRADTRLDSLVATRRNEFAHTPPLLFVHTDKGLYATGDHLWFSTYALDPARYLPVSGQAESALQVDLIAPDGRLVQHQWLRMTDGRVGGNFRLADTLASGMYRLRAYTISDTLTSEPTFTCSFPVYNIQRPTVASQTSQSVVRQTGKPGVPALPIHSLAIQFLPEGGRWLAGRPGKLGIKAVQPNGHGRAISGRIVDQRGTEVIRFITNPLGMGHVLLTPQAGQHYLAYIDPQAGVNTSPVDLPAVDLAGWSLAADACSDSTRLLVTVRATGHDQNEPVYVTLQNRDQVVYYQKWQLPKGEAQFALPTTTLLPGVCRLTLWDHTGQARAERLVFVPERTSPVQMRIILDKSRFAPRETVAISFQLRDGDTNPVAAFWSASVTDDDQLPLDTTRADLRTHLLLTGELRGTIESPSTYLEAGQSGAIDDLLLTQGRRRLPATQSTDSTGGWTLSGHVRNRQKRLMPNTPVLLSLEQGGQQMVRTLFTDAQGHFQLNGLMIDDTVQVRARAIGPGESGAVVTLDAPGMPGAALSWGDPNSEQPLARFLASARTRQTAFPAFYRDTTARQLEEVIVRASKPVAERPPDVQRASIHGEADGVLTVNKTLASSFTTMDQLLRLVPGVQLVNGAIRIRSYSTFGNLAPPLYLIDGVYADEATVNQLIPHEVVRIELLKNASASIYGVRGANGVIAIYTRKGDPEKAIKTTSLATTVRGFVAPREFYVPRYDRPGLRPDADKRDVLYWKPLGQTGADGLATLLFPLSDTAQRIRLVVQGITTEGVPISFTWVLPVR